MSIANKNWRALDDKMPGTTPKNLTVSGTVTVPDSATVARLVRSAKPGAFNHLSLDLELESKGICAQVLTEKPAVYTQESGADIVGVSIYYKGERLVTIDVEVVH